MTTYINSSGDEVETDHPVFTDIHGEGHIVAGAISTVDGSRTVCIGDDHYDVDTARRLAAQVNAAVATMSSPLVAFQGGAA